MKKLCWLFLLIPSIGSAATITTTGVNMTITLATGTASGGGGGNPAVLQCVHGGQYSSTGKTVSITPANGNTLIVGISQQGAQNFTSLKDNNSNNFTQDNSGWINPSNYFSYFHLTNVSGVTGVAAAFSGNTTWGMIVCEVSNLLSSPVDVMDNTGSSQSGVTSWTTPSVTTTNSNDIVFGLAGNNQGNSFSGSGSWLLAATDDEGGGTYDSGMVYQIFSTSGPKQPAGNVGATSTVYGITASYK